MIRTLLSTLALAGLAGCAPSATGTGAPGVAEAPTEVPADSVAAATEPGPPVVQVRDFPASSTVSAWSADQTFYGLRTQVGRDGELEGGLRNREHWLFLSTQYVSHLGGFVHAVAPSGTRLLRGGVARDHYACFGGDECAPMQTVSVLMPDALLRETGDSLVVRFHPGVGDNWTVTLRRDLVDRYLAAVDSVAAERRIGSLGQTPERR